MSRTSINAKRILMCLFVVVITTYPPVVRASTDGNDYYVSPNGDDANPGTQDKPFRTIERARDETATIVETTTSATVHLAGGVYRLASPLTMDQDHSGILMSTRTYKAEPGVPAIISGGHPVTGWTREGNTLWKAHVDIPDMRHFFVNGVRAHRARGPFPKGAERFGEFKAIDEEAGFILPESGMASSRNPGDIELGFFNSWSHILCKVARITKDGNGARIAMQQPGFILASRKEGAEAKLPDYIENAFELLDEPGEFYFDKPSRTLYYRPRNGEDMEKADAEVPVLETLLNIAGTAENPVTGLIFEGITFADATWLAPNRIGHADVQANFTITPTNLFERNGSLVNLHNEYAKSPANVRVRFASGTQFNRCIFTRLGGAGLDIDTGSQGTKVTGCRFYDISGSGIQIGDVTAADHHPSSERLIVRDTSVTNCFLYDCGVEYEDSVAVFAGYTQNTTIAHNEITSLPYSGISVGWGWGEEDSGGGNYPLPFLYSQPTPARDNHITENHIHDVMRTRNDGGGIYMLGNQPGTVISGNHIHDNKNIPGGIYLDEGSGFIEITGNSVYSVNIPMNYNNLVQDRNKTCNEHDNFFDVKPTQNAEAKAVADRAGLQSEYRDLLAESK